MKQQLTKTLAAGQSLVIAPERAAWTLGVIPGSGATVTVEITATPAALHGADGSGAVWHALGGPRTANELIMAPGPVTGIRATAAGGTVTVELVS